MVTWLVRSGAVRVMPWPVADCTCSGATTETSPRCVSSRYMATMPGAMMPSSLVRRINISSGTILWEMLRLTRAQVGEIDRLAVEHYHIPAILLMENAARAVVDEAMSMLKPHSFAPKATIVCGGGNNGGDGLAVAR